MTALAIDSQGSIIRVDNGLGASPPTMLTIGGVTAIRDLRSGQGAEIDVTDLSSTAKEFRLGLKDEGSMTFDVIYLPEDTGQARLVDLRSSRETGSFEIEVQTSPVFTISWTGIVSAFPFSIGVDDVLRGSVTIRVTGAITEA